MEKELSRRVKKSLIFPSFMSKKRRFQGEQTFDFEFGVPGVAVPPGIFDDSLIPPWLPLPFVMGVLNVVTDDCIMVKHNAFQK